MNMAKYCKNKGMNLQQYEVFKSNITATAQAIRQQLKYNNGMYYNTNEIINFNSDPYIKSFIIQELKTMDIEFYDNNTLYRVTD
jgi:hypothetical protein